jgi:hypothetical protein
MLGVELYTLTSKAMQKANQDNVPKVLLNHFIPRPWLYPEPHGTIWLRAPRMLKWLELPDDLLHS